MNGGQQKEKLIHIRWRRYEDDDDDYDDHPDHLGIIQWGFDVF